jgi:1-acyl-sn-glycerol-3-phosphate acyltransferase
MRGPLNAARSGAAFVLLLAALGLSGLAQRLTLWPLSFVAPALARRLSSAWMLLMARLVLFHVRLGGGRYGWTGQVPTSEACLIVMNHQSLLDIPAGTRLCWPTFPRFVARARYRPVPLIGMGLRLSGAPLVDPERDGVGAIAMLRQAAREDGGALFIYPEGHRTRDGAIGDFETGGIRAILGGKRMPVYLIVADGFWRCRSILDFVFGMHQIRGVARVVGPLAPPEKGDLRPFVAGLRERMVTELQGLRDRAA